MATQSETGEPLGRGDAVPMRGIDPMGPAFGEMAMAWRAAGQPYYRPLPK